MKKTVFRRFLIFALCTSLVCVLIALGVLTYPVSDYITRSKKSTLEHNTKELASYISEISGGDLDSLTVREKQIFTSALDSLASSQHAIVIIAKQNGDITYCSSEDLLEISDKLPQEVITDISDGEHFEQGTLHNIYKHSYYISSAPIKAADSDDIIRYCIVAQATLWTSDYIPSVFLMLIILVIIATLTLFILTSSYVYNTTRPLKQMSTVAKRFAVGDFNSRVHVDSKDELGELADAFNEMAESLSASENMRRNFIANVSHELKTPMTTIAGYIDGMLDGTIPATEQPMYLSIVSDEVKRLSRLVSSMISLSKIDSGEIKVNRIPFVLEDTVFGVLLGFEGELEKKNITVEGLDNDKDTYAYGDRDLIYQVIYNLVENAVKFTDHDGYIKVGCNKSTNRTYMYVENSGAGILPEDLRLVFDKFYKADKSRSSDKKSMGLGLYIVRTIILLHEGNVTVESEPGKYCRFIFWLPNAPNPFKNKRELPDSI